MHSEKITPIILCGGAGSRLWPASREARPKQFLPLFAGESLFDLTLKRISDDTLFTDPVIVTAGTLAPLVLQSLGRAGRRATLLLEPCRRNTAPAIALAIETCDAALLQNPMLVLASDHFIRDDDAFRRAVRETAEAAKAGRIITFGVEPDAPHTGYGYIAKGAPLGGGVFEIKRFIEKPAQDAACVLLAEGCLWNSGNFMFLPGTMRSELRRLNPGIVDVVSEAAGAATRQDAGECAVLTIPNAIFSRAPNISVDYAVLERSHLGACKPVNYRWSDMGTWNALWQHHHRDEQENAVVGPATLRDTTGSLVISEAQHVALVGMNDVAVIVTADAILVAPRKVGATLSELVKTLKADPRTTGLG